MVSFSQLSKLQLSRVSPNKIQNSVILRKNVTYLIVLHPNLNFEISWHHKLISFDRIKVMFLLLFTSLPVYLILLHLHSVHLTVHASFLFCKGLHLHLLLLIFLFIQRSFHFLLLHFLCLLIRVHMFHLILAFHVTYHLWLVHLWLFLDFLPNVSWSLFCWLFTHLFIFQFIFEILLFNQI